jgi:hypothetical protein
VKVETNDVIFLGITETETQVYLIVELIHHFSDTLKLALNKVDSESIRDHFSGVLLMMEELFDYGCPFTPQQHVLTHFLRKPGFFARFSTGTNKDKYLEDSLSNDQLRESNWRPRGLKYTMNEILIDVIEYANMTMDKHWNVVRADLVGQVQVNASLSGMPDLCMYMQTPVPFLHYSFHSSAVARKKRFEEEKVITFTPLDQKFIVFKYLVNSITPQVPFKVTPLVEFEEDFAKIEVKVESRMILADRPLVEELRVQFNLPKFVGKPNIATNIGSLIIDGSGVIWTLGKLSLDKICTLSGRIPVSKEAMPLFQSLTPTLDINFVVIGHSASGTKVEKVLARGENYAPYKGARCVFHSGKFEVRMV